MGKLKQKNIESGEISPENYLIPHQHDYKEYDKCSCKGHTCLACRLHVQNNWMEYE